MSADTVKPAFPASSFGARKIAFSAAARAAAATGSAYVPPTGKDGALSKEERAIEAAAIALLKAFAACEADADPVILAVLAASAKEAEAVHTDRKIVVSAQIKAAAARAADGAYRSKGKR